MTLTLGRSRSSWNHHLNKLGRPHIPNATYKVSRSLSFWFWRRRFLKGFYHIWAWLSSWSCDLNILYTFLLIYHKESSHEICVKLGQWFVRKLCFDILMRLQYERPNRRVAEIQIFEKTYLIVIKDETGLKFKMNDSSLFLIGSYAQKLVASY